MEGLDAIVIQTRTFTTPLAPIRPIPRTSQYSTTNYAAPDRSYNIQTRTKPLEAPGNRYMPWDIWKP